MNPTIARLDRDARHYGVALARTGENSRQVEVGGRLLDYRPGGKGVLRVRSYVDGDLDCEVVVSIERVRAILRGAARL